MCCILCLEAENRAVYIDIYSSEGSQLEIKRIIEKHFWLRPDSERHTTRSICAECWDALYAFHRFYLQIQKAHKLLENVAETEGIGKIAQEARHATATRGFILKEEFVKLETDVETEAKPMLKRRRGRPRRCKPPYEPANLIPEKGLSELHIEEFYIESVKVEKSTKETVVDAIVDDANDNVCELTTVRSASNCDVNSDCPLETATPAKHVHSKKTVLSRQFDEFISSNFELSCCLCKTVLANFTELKTHFRVQHKIKGYVLCCGKKLLKRGVLVDHIHTHLDPSYFKCPQCEKVLADRRCLEAHLKVHEDKRERVFECDVCSKRFYRRSILWRHAMLHVPEDQRKFACPHCEKTFATKYLMNQHVKLTHLKAYAKICDVCGKSICGREALQRHQEEHKGLVHESIQCDLCGLTLTNKYGLARHMKVMHTTENREPQVCNICSKVSPSLCAHQRHVKYMHTMERKHSCPMCDKAFKHNTNLKEHMTTHTGEVLYTCPHCPKTFNSNANMHSHRKKAHRQEWEKKRLERYQQNSNAVKKLPMVGYHY